MLMDEPFAAVDPIVRERLQNVLLRSQQDIGKTIDFLGDNAELRALSLFHVVPHMLFTLPMLPIEPGTASDASSSQPATVLIEAGRLVGWLIADGADQRLLPVRPLVLGTKTSRSDTLNQMVRTGAPPAALLTTQPVPLAALVALYPWMHTRHLDISEQRILTRHHLVAAVQQLFLVGASTAAIVATVRPDQPTHRPGRHPETHRRRRAGRLTCGRSGAGLREEEQHRLGPNPRPREVRPAARHPVLRTSQCH